MNVSRWVKPMREIAPDQPRGAGKRRRQPSQRKTFLRRSRWSHQLRRTRSTSTDLQRGHPITVAMGGMLLSARSYPSHPKLAIPNWQLRARHRILEDVGSPAAAAAPPSHLRWLRRSLDALVVLLILLGLGLGVLYWRLRAGQPDLDGKLQLDGLSAPVTIVRDQLGVPHISAQNVHDLYLAQGFAMAQDRLWQM